MKGKQTEALKSLAQSLAVWHLAAAETHYCQVALGSRADIPYTKLTPTVTKGYWSALVNISSHPTGKALVRVTMTPERLEAVTDEAQDIGQAMVREFPERYPHFIAARTVGPRTASAPRK